ncbi:MAG: efflux RND transporter periplasmic adaptor subunit [Saprospiraceae bacterium]|nr:efflux RND transporter periplasmic adaptor subunit [Saprospiraceae bacterium]
MKNNSIILLVFGALAFGLGAGYLLFGGKSNHTSTSDHHHHQTETTSPDGAEQIWTCSMHPQIRQNESGDCPICGMDLITLDQNNSNDPLILEMTREAVKLANIETSIIGAAGKPEKSFTLSGKIKADERLAASQVAHIPGRIEKLFVTFTGEKVTKGQELATVYSPQLVSAQQELLEALKVQDINADLAEAARKKLAYWKISEEQIQEIENSGTIQETFTILADVSGIVTHRRVAVGDYVRQGEVLYDITSLNRVWVLFDAYEEDLASVEIGDRVEFTTPAVPNKIFSTRIRFIDPILNPNTRVASLRGELQNPGLVLKPEMFVRGELQAQLPAMEQLLVPKSAILWTGPRSVVYVKVPDTNIPTFQFREIESGERVGDRYLVRDGLDVGEEIVTYGNFAIDAAAQLNNQASMMNKNVLLEGNDSSQPLPDYTDQTPVAFQEQIVKLTHGYLILKDALVATDPVLAKTSVTEYLNSLSKVDNSLLEDEAHMYWMEQQNVLQTHGEQISALDDVEQQREQFDFISQALIHTIKAFGIPDDAFYVQYCPMAFDYTGAEWISDVAEIRNPYFGDVMLTCGLVQETITKDFRNPAPE